MQPARITKILALVLVFAVALPPSALAAEIVIPAETPVYAELFRDVTSRKKETGKGDVVPARVRGDVVVDGAVVIEEGAELLLRVSAVKKARFFGRKGRLELEALSVEAVDGSRLPLHGAERRTGKGRKAATAALTFAVAWPFLFIRGKNARVPAGTIFAAYVSADTPVAITPRTAHR